MVLRFSRAKQRQGNVEKSVLHVKSCFCFLLIGKQSVLHVQSCFFFLLIRKKRVLHVQNLFLAY